LTLNHVTYYSTFSDLAIIKLFFGNVKFCRNYLFERLKILKLEMEGKIHELLGRGQSTIGKQVSNN
jgi:hypothetical protein